jgi:FkbM family methyltransferase
MWSPYNILRTVHAKARQYLIARLIAKQVTKTSIRLQRLGTKYGGWTFVPVKGLRGGLVVSCGAGEDISFDIELVRHYGCRVVIVDPTPRAIAHFRELSTSAQTGRRCAINGSRTEFYDLANVDLNRLSFVDKAVWDRKGLLKFYEPRDPNHVSHSIVNLQRTEGFIEVEACTLSDVLRDHGNRVPVLVKLDIEGAENVVVRNFLKDRIFPQQILVEFDELLFPRRNTRALIWPTLQLLRDEGYCLIFFDGSANCLFVRCEVLEQD